VCAKQIAICGLTNQRSCGVSGSRERARGINEPVEEIRRWAYQCGLVFSFWLVDCYTYEFLEDSYRAGDDAKPRPIWLAEIMGGCADQRSLESIWNLLARVSNSVTTGLADLQR
jgi:hypothetical protein